MPLRFDDDATCALGLAEEHAAKEQRTPRTLHLLRALLAVPGPAQRVLLGIPRAPGAAPLAAALSRLQPPPEPASLFLRVQERAQAVAENARAERIDGLHMLLAMLRLREAQAFAALEAVGAQLAGLRNAAVTAMAEQAAGAAAETGATSAQHRHDGGRTTPALPRTGRPSPPATATTAAAAGPLSRPSRRAAHKMSRGRVRRRERPTPVAQAHEAPLHEVAPTLSECAIDLTQKARAQQLDAAIGRDKEIEAIADILGKRRANNPVLVGPAGVGKTAIVEGLAVRWAQSETPHARLVALDTTALVAGTGLRGSLSERLTAIKDEVRRAQGNIVVFIDELHQLIGAGATGDGPQDAAGELKTALARGEFPCIGATTEDECKRYIERDPALVRRFSPVQVGEPDVALATTIVQSSVAPYEQHHGVHFLPEAIEAAVHLTHRFVGERKLPDKAFAALDLAGSRARRRQQADVGAQGIAEVVHEWTGVPLARLNQTDAERFANAESHLQQHIVGHRHVVAALARALRRAFAGFGGSRPMGSFLFLGPTGVGKTQMAKALAQFLFGDKNAMVRLDMSEFGEKHAVARLLGAQPGYVGYEEGGQLTEALRKRPFQIVLFDEIEKAHPDVLNVLLQLLDEGHLTDAQGRKVRFTHTLVLLTSNLGASAIRPGAHIGFGGRTPLAQNARQAQAEAVRQAARAHVLPELWSRLDEHLVFLPLLPDELHAVAERELRFERDALIQRRGVGLRWDEAVVAFLLRHASAQAQGFGARGLRKMVALHVQAPLAERLLAHPTERPHHYALRVDAHDETLAIEAVAADGRAYGDSAAPSLSPAASCNQLGPLSGIRA